MTTATARNKPPIAPVIPPDGRIEFPDGDWVQVTLDPTHGQSKVIAKAVLAASQSGNRGDLIDLMAEAVVAIAEAGKLTDRRTREAIPFPFTVEGIDAVSGIKITAIFKAVMAIPDLLPNL